MPRIATDTPKLTVNVGAERKRRLITVAESQGLGVNELIRRWIDAGCPTTKER